MPGYGKYRSPEEKEEFVKQLGADAKQRVIDLAENWEADAKDVAEFLIFSSRFPDYSVRNQMLIYKQNPYAMFTAGYNQFEKMGYTVQKGEKGMRIWVPHNITYYRGKESEPWKRLTKSTPKAVRDMIKAGMLETREELQFYRYGVVFDIAQTNCPAEDYPKLVGLGCADELHAAAFDIISEYSNRCGMPVRCADITNQRHATLRLTAALLIHSDYRRCCMRWRTACCNTVWIPAKAVHSVSLKQTLYPLCLNPPWVCQSLTHVRST